MPAQALVAMAEEPGDDGAQGPGRQPEPRLQADPDGDQAAARRRREGAFVFPGPLAQHLRALEEAAAGIEPGQADLVVVEGQQAEEQDPAAADRDSDLDALGVESLDSA